MPETEPHWACRVCSLRLKPQSPAGGLPSRAKVSLVYPIDGGTCGRKALKNHGGVHLFQGQGPTSSLLPKISPHCRITAPSARENSRAWDWWEAGQRRVRVKVEEDI